ncbi:hypothetical protein M1O18_06495, partial [Dehalococcoidia bacterium]|nr:hypothetical protein [Dehalococcoidia bacterium]
GNFSGSLTIRTNNLRVYLYEWSILHTMYRNCSSALYYGDGVGSPGVLISARVFAILQYEYRQGEIVGSILR